MIITKHTRDLLLDIAKTKKVFLEGNILKIIQVDDGDVEFKKYLKLCITKDKQSRTKRLQITKQIQTKK